MTTRDPQILKIYEPVQELLPRVEAKLGEMADGEFPYLGQLLGHVLANPGKRMRPAITLLASRLHPSSSDMPVLMAAAVELLHLASLVHDDTVDRAALRHGQATISTLWGGNVAVLLGDYLFATSATLVCDTGNIRVVRRFAETILALSSGELMELAGAFNWRHTYEQYQQRIARKTASLFQTATESGAVLSGAPEEAVAALRDYGHNLGMAFQIVDDILDFQGTEEDIGKPVGNDLAQGTLTLPSLLLLQRYPKDNPVIALFQGIEPEANRERAVARVKESGIIEECFVTAREFCQKAAQLLDLLPDVPARDSLRELTAYVTERRV